MKASCLEDRAIPNITTHGSTPMPPFLHLHIFGLAAVTLYRGVHSWSAQPPARSTTLLKPIAFTSASGHLVQYPRAVPPWHGTPSTGFQYTKRKVTQIAPLLSAVHNTASRLPYPPGCCCFAFSRPILASQERKKPQIHRCILRLPSG